MCQQRKNTSTVFCVCVSVDIVAITTETARKFRLCVFISYHRRYHHKHSIWTITSILLAVWELFVVIFVCQQHVWEHFAQYLRRHSRRENNSCANIYTKDDDGICQYNEILICTHCRVEHKRSHVERFDEVVSKKGPTDPILERAFQRWMEEVKTHCRGYLCWRHFIPRSIRVCVCELNDMYNGIGQKTMTTTNKLARMKKRKQEITFNDQINRWKLNMHTNVDVRVCEIEAESDDEWAGKAARETKQQQSKDNAKWEVGRLNKVNAHFIYI